MEYHNNILCVSGNELIQSEQNPTGPLSFANYKNYVKRGHMIVARRACLGKPALIDFNTLPASLKDLLATTIGVPEVQAAVKPFKDKIVADGKAIEFYSNYTLADGRLLPAESAREYSINASVLNAIKLIKDNGTASRQALGGTMKKFWAKALVAVNNVRVEKGHTLPSAEIPLKRKFERYLEMGYEGLVSGKYCNDNSRKVSDKIENLLMSLYAMPNKPFAADVHTMYLSFIAGKIKVADRKTGEIFEPSDFISNGKPLELSESTVKNYLNQPHNRVVVDKVRSGSHRFNSTSRPHHHRHSPEFSFSKISMDDRDLPRKCDSGKWVKAYYAYDVTSGCRIGAAYSLDKNERLFLDCMQDMFRLIERNGFGMPMEVEVENHLVNKFFDDLAIMFPFVRICNPGNSQEKRAEHFNKAAKYSVEKKTQNNIGRWYGKHEAYTVDRDKVNDEFVEKSFTLERLIADDKQVTIDYNNQLHPKQKKYPGKTRWQVLVENMNSNVARVSKAVVYKAIGERTSTTIMRNQYCTVQYNKYQIADVALLDRLLPNNYSVEAYYLPDGEGMIGEVYLYQQGVFLCEAAKIITYNESKAEQTHVDKQGYMHQSAYVATFDKMAKDGKGNLIQVALVNEVSENLPEVKVIEEVKEQEPVKTKGEFKKWSLEDF